VALQPADLSHDVNLERIPPQALLIEDCVPLGAAIADVLVANGLRVRETTDSARGLILAEHLCADIVFLDLGLPGHSALELLHALRAARPTRDIPALVQGTYALIQFGDDVRFSDGTERTRSDLRDLLTQVCKTADDFHQLYPSPVG
jgi:CheY-like chemotaxis protein